MKLLLDEHYSKRIAEMLRGLGHDVVAVAERSELRAIADERLLVAASAESRALLTENYGDFAELLARADDHSGVVFTSRKRFPRSRETIGRYVEALDAFLKEHPAEDALRGDSRWL